jgi:hypothetical protein
VLRRRHRASAAAREAPEILTWQEIKKEGRVLVISTKVVRKKLNKLLEEDEADR